MKLFDSLEAWITTEAWPTIKTFMGGIVHSEVTVLAPIAQTAVANLTAEESAALLSGNTANTGHILAKVVSDTTAAAEAAGIQAGASSILTAVGAATQPKTGS